ncbi:PadR family transcriptional regulator [Streptomyces sp. Je 1-4]|uniref:PadR family transcriptional regulator n=1 Tax=Streptomyces TaxID=1883 RepID=UPI00140F32CD|nr:MULTISPECIES: PadR family transcriptional regulator [unclassified Streptomyces]QIK04882.1 PadR family transcriptional regulator [Streptomyces sp. ID38640]UYB38043.1 PadR family transcriptional regulator [Streptomyces sp. Je 1-4]UZQ33978.1 PadR family transcriptional regulator [Streptomyces sp. Je 1-4] [Streptomyces sp. Je 1-4 4N24]UZQ41396.1 PadR family transcriptional regulator [Streptomyces sp. Je 1-4] [Streptomyces sp. Je 1-4 4N24_ara]
MTATVKSSPLGLTVLVLLHHRPLHPYGIQQLLKQWGKVHVVNVGQRAGLYRTIERLQAGGLIAVRQTERDQLYPERTVYEVTDEGRAVTRDWLEQMLAVPKAEFPVFPAALSNMLMLSPAEVLPILERRAARLADRRAELERQTADAEPGLPRITLIENEYLLAVLGAEERWLQGVMSDIRDGSLTWSAEMLAAFQEASEASEATSDE